MTDDIRTAAQRECETCGKLFEPTDDGQKYCEQLCKRQNYAMRRYGFEYGVQWRQDQEAKRARPGPASGHRSLREFNGDDVWRDDEGAIWQTLEEGKKAVRATIDLTIARVTPTREQVIDVLRKHQHDYCEECHMSHGCTCGWRHKDGSLSTDEYDGEDPVGSISEHQTEVLLALLAGLAEGESSG